MNYEVSVRLMTYNHEKYIRQSIDSIFSQHTNFQVEIVIGDDLSSDKTLEIVKSYKNTENIKLNILSRDSGDTYSINRKKYGRLYNFYDIIQNCKGKYIALLDGDDYWTDPLKLQKQVDFLNSHPDHAAVTSNTQYLKDGKLSGNYKEAKESWLGRKFPLEISYADIVFRVVPHVSSFLFRNNVRFPEKYSTYPVGDMPLFLLLADMGKIRFVELELLELLGGHPDMVGSVQQAQITVDRTHEASVLRHKHRAIDLVLQTLIFAEEGVEIDLREFFKILPVL